MKERKEERERKRTREAGLNVQDHHKHQQSPTNTINHHQQKRIQKRERVVSVGSSLQRPSFPFFARGFRSIRANNNNREEKDSPRT